MSGNPPTQPTNVVPMPTNWPGPMFTPKTWPSSPSCFSELAGLNACYDSVQMMEQILAKVMTDLVTNDVAVQQAIVKAIAASGSNVPLIGVTNGSAAQPGQVGEYVQVQQAITYPAAFNQQIINMGVLQPGDWLVSATCVTFNYTGGILYTLTPIPPGVSNQMSGASQAGGVPGAEEADWVQGTPAQANITAPTLFAYNLITNTSMAGNAVAGTGAFYFQAWRMR